MFMQDPGHPMTAALVKEFGIYPPGCYVRLVSGENGVALRSELEAAFSKKSAAEWEPLLNEAGVPGYEVVGWYGMAAPAKTPKAIINRLNDTMIHVLPELRERYAALGMDLAGGTAGKFDALLRSERDKWAKVVKLSGAKVE